MKRDKGDLIFDIACGATMVLVSTTMLLFAIAALISIIKG